MKVLVAVARDFRNPSSAGGDQHLTLLAQDLASQGHEVTIWCSRADGLAAEERYDGVRVERIAPLPWLAPTVWRRFLTGGARSYDLVIEDLVGGARAPFLAALLARRPHVGMWFQDNRPLFRTSYSRPMALLAGAVQAGLLLLYRRGWSFVPSEATRAWLVSNGLEPARIHVVPRRQPIPGPTGGPRPFAERRNRIVCIGNLRPLKGLHRSIELLARVRPVVPDAELIIAGRRSDAGYLRRLESMAAAPAVAGAVEIRTDISEEEKHAILGRAKVLTIHSPIEGLGWTVIEAGVYGVPAVVPPGVPEEVVRDGLNGRRIPEGDDAAFASAIVRLLTEADEWTRLSEGARAVARRFTEKAPDPALSSFAERVAGGGAPSPAAD